MENGSAVALVVDQLCRNSVKRTRPLKNPMKMPSSAGIDRPFPGVASSDRYLAIGPIEEARGRICRMLDRCEGLGVVIGPPGTGKTLLCQRIAAQYRNSHTVVVLGDIRVTSRMGLIQQVLFHLRKSHQGLDEQALQLALIETLASGNHEIKPLLLIIDEAQMLTVDLLDEIRMLTNLVRDGRPLVQTVLVGGPKLEDALVDPQLESLTQRIVTRCYLHPMTQSESAQYTRSLLASTGLKIQDDAIGSLHHACGGVPRLINQLMNQAVDFASLRRQTTIDDACIQCAWADLQQLPSPVIEPKLRPQRSDIEFGELDSAEVSRPLDNAYEAAPATQPEQMAVVPARSGSIKLADTDEWEQSENQAASVATTYVDMESILASSSIVCSMDPGSSTSHSLDLTRSFEYISPKPPQPFALQNVIPPLEKQSTNQAKKTPKVLDTQKRNALFGIDFTDEILVDVRLAEAIGKQVASTVSSSTLHPPTQTRKPAQAAIPTQLDVAAEEISLRDEILQMSRSAVSAGESRNPHASLAEQTRASLPSASKPAIQGEALAPSADDEWFDVPRPLAVLWRDEEPHELEVDDRDMLVIEDDVTLLVDPPSSGKIGNGIMRKPPAPIDQQYQSLFSRLRNGD